MGSNVGFGEGAIEGALVGEGKGGSACRRGCNRRMNAITIYGITLVASAPSQTAKGAASQKEA